MNVDSKIYIPQMPIRVIRDNNGKIIKKYPDVDYSSALKYGSLVKLLPDGFNPMLSQPMIAKLRTGLKDFSDNDFLILTGDPIAIGAACTVAAKFNRGKVNILKWNKRTNEYLLVRLEL